MPNLLIASKNKHKIEKLTTIFETRFNQIKSLYDFFLSVEVEENGSTLIENAKIKAIELSNNFDGYVIATDGGAVIPALENIWNPLFTKRFAGDNKTDPERITAMLELMKGKKDRRVWFIEAFVICKNGQVIFETEIQSPVAQMVEKWDGRIRFGAYLLALWYLPNRQKMFFDLTQEEMIEEENTWRELGQKVSNFNF